MAIRAAAQEAWMQARSSREGEARDAMAATLTPFDVATLVTVDVEAEEAFTLFVFRDPADDVHLAVRLRGSEVEVLVVVDDGGWTVVGAPVRSLAHLWELLPAPAVPEWSVGVVVSVGERYMYNGALFEVVQAHTTQADWAPDKAKSLWAKVS